MATNPYQSPEGPEEPVQFRAIGETWHGWQKMRQIGAWSLAAGVIYSFAIFGFMEFTQIKPPWYAGLPTIIFVVGGIALWGLSRLGAYAHSVVLMFRDEYN
jgi:hypothetical protein